MPVQFKIGITVLYLDRDSY